MRVFALLPATPLSVGTGAASGSARRSSREVLR